MALLELLDALRRRWRTALAAFALAALAAILLARLLPAPIGSTTSSRLEFQPVAASTPEAVNTRIYIESQLRAWGSVLERDDVIAGALSESGSARSVTDVRQRLTVNVNTVNALHLTFQGAPETDTALLDALARRGCAAILATAVKNAAGQPTISCVADRAQRAPSSATGQFRSLGIPLGLLLALAVAGVAVAVRESTDPRLGRRPAVRRGERELPVLATIGRDADGPARLRSALAADPARVVSLAGPGSGRVAAALTSSLEAAGERVETWEGAEIVRRAGLGEGSALDDAAASPALAAAVAGDDHDHLLLVTGGSPITTRSLAGVADATVLTGHRHDSRRRVEDTYGALLDVDARVAGLVVDDPVAP